jgi:hypothetical protein
VNVTAFKERPRHIKTAAMPLLPSGPKTTVHFGAFFFGMVQSLDMAQMPIPATTAIATML